MPIGTIVLMMSDEAPDAYFSFLNRWLFVLTLTKFYQHYFLHIQPNVVLATARIIDDR
jgi:hypothetical protein